MENTETKQTKGLKRNTIDKYYTKEAVVVLCLSHVKRYLTIAENDLIIEPSAGNGAFITGIKSLSQQCQFYDIEPEIGEIVKQDYLLIKINKTESESKTHVIGNPPFGRQSSLAIKFIKKSCEFCDSLSFILPKSFKKDSLKKTFPLRFHLLLEVDLPEKSFLVAGVEHDVPCVFQIWQKRAHNRSVIEAVKPLNFAFVKKNENPDISFRRVGVNAGAVTTDIHEKSIQSHYFIKFQDDVFDADLLERLSKLTFKNSEDTVGPKSISKQELIAEFNKGSLKGSPPL